MSVFVDTTILVYAHSEGAAEKHLVANRLVRELWQLPVLPVISVQVCKERWRSLQACEQMEREVADRLVESYLQWRVVPEDRPESPGPLDGGDGQTWHQGCKRSQRPGIPGTTRNGTSR